MLLWLLLGPLVFLTLVFALVGVLYITRGVHVRHVGGRRQGGSTPAVDDPFFCETVALLTRTTLEGGHRAEIFVSGDETYPRLWDDLRGARRSITIQLYYCQPGRLAEEFKTILLDRARAGVKVLFLADAFGSGPLPKEYFAELRAGGVETAHFRPKRWYDLHKWQQRSHIRVIVVDGSVAWTGGFGLDDKWLGDGRHEGAWRDTNVRFEGPCVLQHQGTFAAGWAEATGVLLAGDAYFPPGESERDGDVHAGVLHAAPTVGSTVAERFMALTLAAARRRLFISNAYFVPSDEQTELLVKAAGGGADVRVLTAAVGVTDAASTYYAGSLHWEKLLRGGVRIFEYQPSMMHAKTIVADGAWLAVGTMNFDNRSMTHNDETMFLARDERLGRQLEEVFEEDLRYAREVTLEGHLARPLSRKLRERVFDVVSRLL